MKKKLKSELVSLAHRILKMNSDSNYGEMQQEAQRLYETLTVLAFAERHFDGINPTLKKADIVRALQEKDVEEVAEIIDELEEPTLRVEENFSKVAEIAKANELIFEKARKNRVVEMEMQSESRADDRPKTQESLYEPVIEKIKDMVAQMPPEADAIDEMFQKITGSTPMKNDKKDVGDPDQQPVFQKKETVQKKKELPAENKQTKSLNDRLNKGLSFGLNDRIAFIKHLFNGSTADFNRVLSQLNTLTSGDDAIRFVDERVKPDYKNWEGKELYETRFKDLIEKKFAD